MKNLDLKIALLAIVSASLVACGGGTNTDASPATTPVATTPVATTPVDTATTETRVSRVPSIYYYDANGQWRLVAGVTAKQAKDAGVLCEYRANDTTRNAYLAAGRTVEWVDANITILDLCPGY